MEDDPDKFTELEYEFSYGGLEQGYLTARYIPIKVNANKTLQRRFKLSPIKTPSTARSITEPAKIKSRLDINDFTDTHHLLTFLKNLLS